MYEPIPESVPTSADPKSKRATKRRALSPSSQHASQVTALFAKPDREINIPDPEALKRKSTLPPPPEIVANVQGSSAGAGSGEFHVYKASRRREYERIKRMEDEVAKEEADAEFESKQADRKKKDLERTSKNRKKREKMKLKKGKKGDSGQTHDRKPRNGDDSEAMDETVDQNEEVTSKVEEIGVIIHDDN